MLYSRYRSAALALIVMGNIPLALIGSVIAFHLAGQPLSVVSMVGFITLAGIAARNGILKISHYVHLALHEGESFGRALIVRGSLERLAPVLMTRCLPVSRSHRCCSAWVKRGANLCIRSPSPSSADC
jgi:heavy-metal exporter, HME family